MSLRKPLRNAFLQNGMDGNGQTINNVNFTNATLDGLSMTNANGSFAAQIISASGDSTPTIGSAAHTQAITLSGATAGTGARVSLPITGRSAGNVIRMPVTFAADASRLRVYNVNVGGTLLLDQTNDSTARKFFAEFVFTGTAWALLSGEYYA